MELSCTRSYKIYGELVVKLMIIHDHPNLVYPILWNTTATFFNRKYCHTTRQKNISHRERRCHVICGPSSCRFPQGVYRLRTSVENHCRWWTQRGSAPPEVQHRHFHKRTQGITTMTRKWEAMIDLTSFFGNFPCLQSKKMEKQHIHWNIQQLKQVRISGPTCTFSWAASKLPSCKSILPRAALPPMSLLKISQSMSVISGIPDVQDHMFVAIDVNHSTPTYPFSGPSLAMFEWYRDEEWKRNMMQKECYFEAISRSRGGYRGLGKITI